MKVTIEQDERKFIVESTGITVPEVLDECIDCLVGVFGVYNADNVKNAVIELADEYKSVENDNN